MEETEIKTVIIRYQTPSRAAIKYVITQGKNQLGDWMMPTILVQEGGIAPYVIESGQYMDDTGRGRLIAAHYFDEFAMRVKNHEAEKNRRVEIDITET